jgi:uncharacterized membrane protein YbhN (UPF0104 family)
MTDPRVRTVWIVSILSSAVLLALVIAQVDWRTARALVSHIDYRWIVLGLSLLLVEGVVTAVRLHIMARPAVRFRACIIATAWYVLLLISLPARLGEVAGVAVIVRHMGQRPGTAAASLLFQRVCDVIVLAALLALVCTVVLSGPQSRMAFIFIALVIAVLIAVMVLFEQLLALCVRPLLSRRRKTWPRRILRLCLQARGVRRHHLDRRLMLRLGGLSVLKSLVNLTGIACVVAAVVPSLAAPTAVGLGIVYNLAAVIPIQTVGGFGLSEAVLLGSFKWLGYSLAAGAPLALAIRLALICAPLAFWLLTIGVAALSSAPRTRTNG